MSSIFKNAIVVLAGVAHVFAQTTPLEHKPDISMTIGLKPDKARPGSEVILTIDLRNTSSSTVSLYFSKNGPGPEQYTITVVDQTGTAAPLNARGRSFLNHERVKNANGIVPIHPGGGSRRAVPPGAVLHETFPLSALVDLSRTGDYTISLKRVDMATKQEVDSNVVHLAVAE